MSIDISKSQQDLNSAVEAWVEHQYFGTVNSQPTKGEVVNLNLVLAWESFSKATLETEEGNSTSERIYGPFGYGKISD